MQDFFSDPTSLSVLAAGLLAGIGVGIGVVWRSGSRRRSSRPTAPRPGVDYRPGVGDDAELPRDTPVRTVETVRLPDADSRADSDVVPDALPEDMGEMPGPAVERPEPVAGRLSRLRARLARSESAIGRRLLDLLTRDKVDEATWEEIEETLIAADLGTDASLALVGRLRNRYAAAGGGDVRGLLREELLVILDPARDRSLGVLRHDEVPAVVLVVGVNGSGKTTTVGKLSRLLVAGDSEVLLGAADTFRAAAADQLQTWGERVGVATVRSHVDGADPASVAHDAVAAGIEGEVDVVIVDTAGRLQNKRGLMDELGKVKRVVEKLAPVTETLLVLDATTGQNGLVQARVFAEAVNITGVVLTKLDGTAKGGIVVSVERDLGVPVKLVGLGEGPDDLAPFEPEAFVDGLLGGVSR